MTRHRRSNKVHPLDDPNRWDEDIAPPFFDRQGFQDRIDALVGKNRDGKSIVRLIWGPESIGLFGVPRYWLRRTKDGEEWRYITVKRWYLETRIEREAYGPSWEKARYAATEPIEGAERCGQCGNTGEPIELFDQRHCRKCGAKYVHATRTIDRGEVPEEFFQFAWMCAEHEDLDEVAGWPKCCERADKDRHRRCFGEFRSPNEYDLECISAGLRRRDKEHPIDPYAPLSALDLTMLESSSGLQTERWTKEIEDRQQQILRDQRVLSERGGTFHDLGGAFKKTESGLLIPNN